MKTITIIAVLILAFSLPVFSQEADTTAVTGADSLQIQLEQTQSDAQVYRKLLLASLLERDNTEDLIVNLYLENQLLRERLQAQADNIQKLVDDFKNAKTDDELKAVLKKYKLIG